MENNIERTGKPLIAIGEKLRQAREKKSLTIDQVQKQTHIHSTVLVALEEGKCDELLTATYVKSFLKKYSDHLGLDSKAILSEYSPPSVNADRAQPEAVKKMDAKSTVDYARLVRVGKYTLILLVILFFTIFLGQKISGVFKKIKAAKPSAAATQAKVKAPSKRRLTKEAMQDNALKIKTPIPASASLNLVLKTKQPVLVKVKVDGSSTFERVLPKGAVESFKADDRIELYVARAEVIELNLNGNPLGSPGKGIIKNLEITRKGIRIK